MLFFNALSAKQNQTHYFYIEEAGDDALISDNAYVMLSHSITRLNYNYVLGATNCCQSVPID